MKTTLIALGAALTCWGAAHAQSTVQLSGLVDMYAGSMKKPGEARKSVLNSGGMTTSWWGMNGTEDLGGGLKAQFALGAFFQADDGSFGRFRGDVPFARDANVALSGGFGSLKLGRSMAPNFLPTILFNPLGDSFAFSPLVLHALGANASDTGWSNQITYTTANYGGLSANIHYQFGEQASHSGANNVGANLLYFSGPLALTAMYEKADMLNNPSPEFTTGKRRSNWLVGASYDFKVVKLYGTYGQSDEKFATPSSKIQKDTFSVGLDVPVTPAGTFKAAYAYTKRDKVFPTADTKRNTYTLGYDHFLSKRTDAYTAILRDRDTEATTMRSGTSFGIGIRHRF